MEEQHKFVISTANGWFLILKELIFCETDNQAGLPDGCVTEEH